MTGDVLSSSDGREELTEGQRAGLDTRRADQDRTLEAMHQLEAALGSAAPGREQSWGAAVLASLTVLDEATREESENADLPDSLLSDMARTQPRLRNRVRGVRLQYRQVRDSIASLRRELERPIDAAVDVADLRERLSWLMTALRHQRARESDLIYEAYYEAFKKDLGEGDSRWATERSDL